MRKSCVIVTERFTRVSRSESIYGCGALQLSFPMRVKEGETPNAGQGGHSHRVGSEATLYRRCLASQCCFQILNISKDSRYRFILAFLLSEIRASDGTLLPPNLSNLDSDSFGATWHYGTTLSGLLLNSGQKFWGDQTQTNLTKPNPTQRSPTSPNFRRYL